MKAKVPTPKGTNDYPGYPVYPASEDIYNHDKEETEIDPADISKKKTPNEQQALGMKRTLRMMCQVLI